MSPTVLVCTALLSEGFRKVCKCWWRQTPPSPRRCQSWLKSKRGFTYINGGCLQVTNILLTFYVRLSLHLMGHTRASALLQAVLMGKLRALLTTPRVSLQGGGRRGGRSHVRSGAGSWEATSAWRYSSSYAREGRRRTLLEPRSTPVIEVTQLNKRQHINSSAITICVSTVNLQLMNDTMC